MACGQRLNELSNSPAVSNSAPRQPAGRGVYGGRIRARGVHGDTLAFRRLMPTATAIEKARRCPINIVGVSIGTGFDSRRAQ